jgi:hypothetical protein
MSEGKYGRLFTEDDVLRIMRYGDPGSWADTLAMFDSGERGPLTFPADEPLFLLRGKDKAAAEAIALPDDLDAGAGPERSYYEAAFKARLDAGLVTLDSEQDDPHLRAVQAAADAMREWQAANPDRVKAPD